jgi:hypothetical protein
MIRTISVPGLPHAGRSLLPVAAVLAALVSLSTSAYAGNIVSDPGFEAAGGGNVYYTGQSIDSSSWYVGAGAVYIDNQDPYVFDGNNSANLTIFNDYATNSLYQILTTVVGQTYAVSFWANSDSPNTFSLTENGNAVSGIPNAIAQNGFPSSNWLGNSSLFVEYSGEFVATSTSTDLTFSAYGNPTSSELLAGDGSVVIDDASVSPVPEPGTIVLLLTGIAGVGLLIARKRLGQSISAGSMLA